MRPLSRHPLVPALTLPLGGLALVLLLAATAVSASAAPAAVGLGTATPFAVLAGQSVSNTGPSLIAGDLGVSPGTSVTGFPPGLVVNGTVHSADAVALQAQNDLTTAYNDAAGRIPDVDKTNQDLGNQTLVAGVYGASSGMALTGTVTLDAQGDPDAVFIFQAGSTLTTASNSTVALLNGAQACHVFWQVGSSATIGTDTTFVGTVMALTSVSMLTGADLQGRALARNGSVTLDDNTITRSDCSPVVGSTPTVSTTPTTAPTATTAPTPTGSPGATPTGGSPTAKPTGTGHTGGPGPTGGTGGPATPTPTDGGGGGGGGGGGSGGPGGPATPPIPTGHPGTGRVDGMGTGGASWLALGLLSLCGAAGAGFLGWKTAAPRTARRRH